ncbi:DNA-binding protein RHL1 [Sesamum alatum]|uniref:DNA-binding protein RHL1 n=1 Tax=Sesamum alatum TaxID=300844 RepID=A0AAE1YDQ0_9LAMI|nr:DNA-binding protein RHL1 [Sesamum alatum]
MARGAKKEGSAAADPEAEERVRLKKLAFSTNVLSQSPAKVGHSAALAPSKTVIKHHGKDILRKSQRKNRYLFSFPGLLAPISGGKIGELKDLGTKNPILYLEFPQGQMKLFGTIVYPKNRYLTLQFSRGGKNVTCDDYFDNMIVFSDAWWIGTKDENPEESRLQFPKELNMEKHVEYDFKGGVGATRDSKLGSGKSASKCLEPESPEVCVDNDFTDSPNDYKELAEVTPTRQSARTAGRTFNFAEASSGDDFIGDGDETPEEEDEKVDTETRKTYTSTDILVSFFFLVLSFGFVINFPPLFLMSSSYCSQLVEECHNLPKCDVPYRHSQTESSSPLVFEIDNEDNAREDPGSGQNKQTGKTKDSSDNDHSSLVQTTLSSLFKKVEEKKAKKEVNQKISTSEASKLAKGGKKRKERDSGQ